MIDSGWRMEGVGEKRKKTTQKEEENSTMRWLGKYDITPSLSLDNFIRYNIKY